MREIVFDTETTGLSPLAGDRVVEIGCVELWNRVETGRTFHAYFNPERPMPSGAEAVHGLTDAFLVDKPRFRDRAADLLEFLGECPLVAHNAAFDFGFLNHELNNCGHPLIWSEPMVAACTRRSGIPAPSTASTLCTAFGRSKPQGQGMLTDRRPAPRPMLCRADRRPPDRPHPTDIVARAIEESGEPPPLESETILIEVAGPPGTIARRGGASGAAAFLATLTDPIWHRLDGRG